MVFENMSADLRYLETRLAYTANVRMSRNLEVHLCDGLKSKQSMVVWCVLGKLRIYVKVKEQQLPGSRVSCRGIRIVSGR